MRCAKCGVELPEHAHYCSSCGRTTTKAHFIEKVTYRTDRVKKKAADHVRLIVSLFVISIVATVSSGAVYNTGNILVPDVMGKEIHVAKKIMVSKDIAKGDIEIYDENGKEIKNSEEDVYYVIGQFPIAGEYVRDGETVEFKCENRVQKAKDAFAECLDENVMYTEGEAKKYDYSAKYIHKGKNFTKDILDASQETQQNYIVDKVGDINYKSKTVSFTIETKDFIKKRAEKIIKAMKGKPLTASLKKLDEIRFDWTITSPDYEDFNGAFKSLDDEAKKDYVVTDMKSVDYDDRSLTVEADTKTHLAEVAKEKKFLKELKGKVPYKGMPEEYIDKTIVGEHDDIEENYIDETTDYTWYSDDGEYTTLVVACADGKVTSVDKRDKDIFWKSNGKPNFSADKDKILEKREEEQTRSNNSSSESSSGGGDMVWIPRTGSKYHYDSSCSNMRNPSKVTKSEAINMGFEPCKKCAW